MIFPSESIHKDFKVICFDEMDSTNEYAWNYITNNTPKQQLLVVAGSQTSGKGQYDREWQTEPYKNITMSVIMSPGIRLQKAFHLNIIVSTAINEAILESTGITAHVKWPNDIYHNDDKLGGILIKNKITQNVIAQSVIGIGLNVNQANYDPSLTNPTSLFRISNQEFDLKELILKIVDTLTAKMEHFRALGINRDYKKYIDALYSRNMFRYFKVNGETMMLKIVTVKENGEIVLENREGQSYNLTSRLEYIIDKN